MRRQLALLHATCNRSIDDACVEKKTHLHDNSCELFAFRAWDRIRIWSVGFCGGTKTGEPGDKTLRAKTRTYNKLVSHMTAGPGIEPGSHWWETSALTTASFLFGQYFHGSSLHHSAYVYFHDRVTPSIEFAYASLTCICRGFNFIFGLNFIFPCYKLITIHYHIQNQRKTKFKPKIKLNHVLYI